MPFCGKKTTLIFALNLAIISLLLNIAIFYCIRIYLPIIWDQSHSLIVANGISSLVIACYLIPSCLTKTIHIWMVLKVIQSVFDLILCAVLGFTTYPDYIFSIFFVSAFIIFQSPVWWNVLIIPQLHNEWCCI